MTSNDQRNDNRMPWILGALGIFAIVATMLLWLPDSPTSSTATQNNRSPGVTAPEQPPPTFKPQPR